jgi:hypothetical protein
VLYGLLFNKKGNYMITLDLDVQEVNFILESLGELPSKSGAYALMMKIKSQGEPQVPPPPDEEKPTE